MTDINTSDITNLNDNSTIETSDEVFNVIYATNDDTLDTLNTPITPIQIDNSTTTSTTVSTCNTPINTQPNTTFTFNEQLLSSTKLNEPVAQLHSDSLIVSMQTMPNNSDVWSHTLSSPLKPLSINTYKRVKQNPIKQYRNTIKQSIVINKRRKLSSDGCYYVYDDECSTSESESDTDDIEPVQYKHTIKRPMLHTQHHLLTNRVMHNKSNVMQRAQRTFSVIHNDDDSGSNSSTDSDTSVSSNNVIHTDTTIDQNDCISDNESVNSDDSVDAESLIPSDLLEVSA